ncbi:hypothetical protein [Parvimonas sp.]|nr:hypothetical protein [Parvimonas sp.]
MIIQGFLTDKYRNEIRNRSSANLKVLTHVVKYGKLYLTKNERQENEK